MERSEPAADQHDATQLRCDIQLDYADRVNFAMQQNGVPLVESIRVTLLEDRPAADVAVDLVLDNGEAEPWTARVASLEPSEPVVVRSDEFGLSGRALGLRTEAEVSAITCTVRCSDRSASRSFAVDVLAFDQWPGVGHWPELTAAFVTPNHGRIAELLAAARTIAGDMTGSDSLDGYQSGSRQRAAVLAEACFHACASRGIGYITPPASFETSGQRVRLADRVLGEQLGTCLDLSLVLASVWEQCGLHPLVLLPEGHAMPAVWTHDAHLPEAVVDEPARIRNLIELGEIVPVEATLLTKAGASFRQALESAVNRMRDPGDAFCAVDVRSARKRGVRPLPVRSGGDDKLDVAEIESSDLVRRSGPERVDRVALADRAEQAGDDGDQPDPQAAAGGRIARWQTRLLDLSLRNRLLNYRASGRTLGLNVPDLAALEDALADGDSFRVLPKTEQSAEFLADELRSGQIYADETAAEVQKRLLKLYRVARSSIEETGANVLYLALGMLKWYETDTSENARLAPLVLLPISLSRKSTGEGYAYSISLTDEPLRPNVTLLEKLRSEFGIETDSLDELPEDEHGLDVDLILRNFRSVIRGSTRWEVVEAASIGLFSFNKFLMWKDLKDNLDRLRSNRLVEHLVERPGQDFDTEPFPEPGELDDRFGPDDILCTRDADSSQLTAVRAAAEGRSFVLEGPPGTGKSQTIANIISNSLASGQRVLFVAEKLAALSVVRKRLEQDGLGPFCLELHSAKASKREVLAQLEDALSISESSRPADWDRLCEGLRSSRDVLNRYVREMHAPRSTGQSLYDVIGRLSSVGAGPSVSLPAADSGTATGEQLQEWLSRIESLQDRSRPVDPVQTYPLRGIGCSTWSFSLPEEARRAIEACQKALSELIASLERSCRTIGVDAPPGVMAHAVVEAVARAAAMLAESPTPPLASLVGPDDTEFRSRAAEAISIGRDRDERRAALLAVYRDEFLDLDYLPYLDAVKRYLDRGAFARFFIGRGLKKKLRIFARESLPPFDVVLDDLNALATIRASTSELGEFADIADAFGDDWSRSKTPWDTRVQQLEWAKGFVAQSRVMRGDGSGAALAEALSRLAASERPTAEIMEELGRVVEAWNAWSDQWSSLAGCLNTSIAEAADAGDGDSLDELARILDRWRGSLSDLNTWVTWRSARDAAVGSGLADVVALYESGGCDRNELESVFWRSFGVPWFNAVADSTDAVRSFNAASHTDAVDRFRELDSRAIEATRGVVASKLAQRAPAAPQDVSSQSEIGILRRELAKKRRHLPTRRLIETMPTLLPRLKPCFLMSPLSVAQFLDSRLPPFDLVVFDEASQIPVWDAIGAIARGTEVIVVGDSKQLPPTSFFNTLDGEDDFDADDHAVEDTESILKECNASGVPRLGLRWHYRSRHETLIAFSNRYYYENQLHTFPSPKDRSDRLGVTFRYVANGVYDRGATRTNRVEAELVVAEVVRQLRDDSSSDSIGIVTFNQAQQNLIEDLLDAERRADPQLEHHFSGDADEPVFVKNLENVQGDERDAIIFSVGYGPDHTGRPSMNFGPLNKEGGERRLNVAVTRAKRRLMVFSSLRSDQIDLKRTRAVGVRHFKAFLDYANRGAQALSEIVGEESREMQSAGLEQSVRDALISLGWEVDTRVGCAGYRIDLAVRHPVRPDEHILGIECDGETYHAAQTARDRDRTRHAVLRGLGWRLARVWSVDWHVNRRGCIERLSEMLRDALADSTASDIGPAEADCAGDTPPDAIISTTHAGERDAGDDEPVKESPPAEEPHTSPDVPEGNDVYTAATYRRNPLGRRDVYGDAAFAVLVRVLGEIIETESPIMLDLARRRLADACRVRSIREQFRDRFEATLSEAVTAGAVKRIDDVLWSRDQSPESFVHHRVAGEAESSRRDLNDVPIIEIRNAARFVVEQQFGLPRQELIRETAARFGIQRVTARIVDRIDPVIAELVRDGGAVEQDGFIRIPAGE